MKKTRGNIGQYTINLIEGEDFDWQSFRAEAAKDILCALILDGRVPITNEQVANSIKLADELIRQLKEKENEK